MIQALLAAALTQVATIKPGEVWPDDRGQHIQAHGGGILKVGDTYYWFGEYRAQDNVQGRKYVGCYASKDLINWQFRNKVLDSEAPFEMGRRWVLERPKVFYNAKTKKFVMYVHLDGTTIPNDTNRNASAYALARVGVLTSDTVDGNYTWVRSFRPLGKESRDIGQFIDDDGSGYLIFESRPTKGFYIAKLSDDYLDVAEETCFIKAPLEGGALVHYDGLYYLIGSYMTGWAPNANQYATSTSLKGPWSEFKDIAPPETKTYGSQSTMMLKVIGSKKTAVIFMGDIWKRYTQWDSRYLWMPVEIGGGKLWLPEPKPWTIDIKTGEVSFPPAAEPATTNTTRLDPSKTWGTWEAWGTSLCWWAKEFGDRDDIADWLFTTNSVQFSGRRLPGLGLNYARYNVGACSWNEVDGRKMVPSKNIYTFRQIEGFWLGGTNWDWNADAKQRAMLQKARDRGVNWFELFSNSPMWWMCKNDNPSGAANGNDDNLSPEHYRDFAVYLATVAQRAKEHWGITFTTVEAFNEPSSNFWSATGRQEGCHVSHETQAAVLPMLREELDKRGLKYMPIAASDETSYGLALATWNSFDTSVKAIVNQVNVHGYQGGRGPREQLRQATAGKRLWNSEYGGPDTNGLLMAQHLHLDLRLLHPTAWTYWQPLDGHGWGLVSTDMRTLTINETNPKYFVLAQYSRHIRPGMTMLDTGETSVAAAHDTRKLVIVVRNGGDAGIKTFDLSAFHPPNGPVTGWITEPRGTTRYESLTGLKLEAGRFECALPADSIQTFEVKL